MTTMRVVGECFFWYRLTRVFPDKFHRAVKRLLLLLLYVIFYSDVGQKVIQQQLYQQHLLSCSVLCAVCTVTCSLPSDGLVSTSFIPCQSIQWFKITSKVKAVITDNARNMTSAVAIARFPHKPCMAHSLQLSILHGFKVAATDVLFAKCHKVVGHFKHSSANTAELMSCNESESPLHKLQQDVPTRWNSIFIIIQSLLKPKMPQLNT